MVAKTKMMILKMMHNRAFRRPEIHPRSVLGPRDTGTRHIHAWPYNHSNERLAFSMKI